jgi:hypothetical protein
MRSCDIQMAVISSGRSNLFIIFNIGTHKCVYYSGRKKIELCKVVGDNLPCIVTSSCRRPPRYNFFSEKLTQFRDRATDKRCDCKLSIRYPSEKTKLLLPQHREAHCSNAPTKFFEIFSRTENLSTAAAAHPSCDDVAHLL